MLLGVEHRDQSYSQRCHGPFRKVWPSPGRDSRCTIIVSNRVSGRVLDPIINAGGEGDLDGEGLGNTLLRRGVAGCGWQISGSRVMYETWGALVHNYLRLGIVHTYIYIPTVNWTDGHRWTCWEEEEDIVYGAATTDEQPAPRLSGPQSPRTLRIAYMCVPSRKEPENSHAISISVFSSCILEPQG